MVLIGSCIYTVNSFFAFRINAYDKRIITAYYRLYTDRRFRSVHRPRRSVLLGFWFAAAAVCCACVWSRVLGPVGVMHSGGTKRPTSRRGRRDTMFADRLIQAGSRAPHSHWIRHQYFKHVTLWRIRMPLMVTVSLYSRLIPVGMPDQCN